MMILCGEARETLAICPGAFNVRSATAMDFILHICHFGPLYEPPGAIGKPPALGGEVSRRR
eukprot:583173-Pyramimonas_sp.AAC.1